MQVLTEYQDSEIDDVLQVTEQMHAHLTAAIVSNDVLFLQKVLANTVNGTTYAGIRARCTGTACYLCYQTCTLTAKCISRCASTACCVQKRVLLQ